MHPPDPTPYESYQCAVCGWVYEEAQGHPPDSIAPGTRWADVPADWCCPECGVDKSGFDRIDF